MDCINVGAQYSVSGGVWLVRVGLQDAPELVDVNGYISAGNTI